jgi:hypothetical protein
VPESKHDHYSKAGKSENINSWHNTQEEGFKCAGLSKA